MDKTLFILFFWKLKLGDNAIKTTNDDKLKLDLTFQTPSAKPPKLRAMKSNLGPRSSTLLSL